MVLAELCIELVFKKLYRDTLGGPVVETAHPGQEVQVQPLVGEQDPTCHMVWPKI